MQTEKSEDLKGKINLVNIFLTIGYRKSKSTKCKFKCGKQK